ncbi:hypothetical protein BGZ46_003798 [Entomortierella lignicola]|nr:hypothetical protein BGZ46_003798 [Entomortierella lignicola]
MASKSKGIKDINNAGSTSTTNITSTINNGNNGNNTSPARSSIGGSSQKGPVGSRPGVYRPCARCRVKKTKCDRLKPACSSCIKGGADVICVYDNDEPTSGTDIGGSLEFSSNPSSPIKKESPPSSSDSIKKVTIQDGSSKAKNTGSSNKSSNGHDTTGTSIKAEATTTPQSSSGSKKPSVSEPPLKKSKSGPSETIKPSPLRSSITTARIPASKYPTTDDDNYNEQLTTKDLDANDGAVDIESVDLVEDKEVLELSIANAAANRLQSEVSQDEVSDATEAPITKRSSSGPIARQKKQNRTASSSSGTGGTSNTTGGNQQSRINVDLQTSKPPTFVIDKNQKARKWGRSSTVVQTLGGEISVPLWTSDQEMLLNEPRPYFIQRSYPMPSTSNSLSSTLPTSGSTSATATNLARMAVFKQMDNTNFAFGGGGGYITPERGTSPDSEDSSLAGATAPSSPRKKKKRGPRKSQQGNIGDHDDMDSISGTTSMASGIKRKRIAGGGGSGGGGGGSHYSSSTAISARSSGGGDDEAGDSSSRSTPAPSSRPRAVPTRPRMYPCSFEGCSKSFMDMFHLKKHETRHVTQEIVCGIDGCKKAYDSISTMRRHQSMVHKERKEEMAAAARAASLTARMSAAAISDSGTGKNSGYGGGDGDGEGGDGDYGQSDISESPAPSSAVYTAVSSPARD